jgi:putative DNA primase/helicase
MSALDAFREALTHRGLVPPVEVLADGKLHRCDVSGKNGHGDGAYIFHADGRPAGGFQNWRDDQGWETWSYANGYEPLTTAERAVMAANIEAAKRAAAIETERRHAEAAKEADRIWDEAKPDAHAYLDRKKVPAFGTRVHDGRLVVPIRNKDRELRSLQFIKSDGTKRSLTGGEKAGGYFSIGKPADVICIGEGFATMATVHEATGHACVVAFDCQNLEPVASVIREKFSNATIIICADDDHKTPGNPGLTKATAAARAVNGRLAVPVFPSDRADDASDFNDLAASAGLEAVARCVANPIEKQADPAPAIHDKASAKLQFVTAEELLERDFPPREMMLAPIIPMKGLAMLYGPRGLGKTYVAMGIAYAVASGGAFLKWQAPKARRVLYIDGEMPAATMQERVALLATGPGPEPEPGMLQFLLADLHDDPLPDLGTEDGQAALEQQWGETPPDLLIIDNLSSLASVVRDNDAESWSPMQTWLLRLRRRGISVLFVHHAGKGGQQRGTSRREDVLDTSMALRRSSDYSPTEGARFEVHLEKARGVVGEDAEPFEVRLQTDDHGKPTWTWEAHKNAMFARACALFRDGTTVRDAAEELGISRSHAGRFHKRAKAEGLISGGEND